LSVNRNFQLAWNQFYKKIIPHKKSKNPFDKVRLIKAQLFLAKSFGDIKLCILGDSNAENLANYELMIKFDPIGLSVNLAIGGTRADHWIVFFESEPGQKVLQAIGKAKILWNIGGNHILQKRMDIMESSLSILHDLFPQSYNCLLPPIWSKYLQSLGTEIEINHQLQLCNQTIKTIWKEKTIDTYTPFLNWESNEPYVLAHKDLVHFSEFGNKTRIPVILDALTDKI
jgi:hypothetical protein